MINPKPTFSRESAGTPMATTEPIVNEYLAAAFRQKHPAWMKTGAVVAENTAAFATKGHRPDIIVCDDSTAPVGVETEFHPAVTVEADAKARLGKVYQPTGGTIHSVIAVKMPAKYRQLQGSAIANAIAAEQSFEYCLYTGDGTDHHRWPATGWIKASVGDLANVVASAKVSPVAIRDGAKILEDGARSVAAIISAVADVNPGVRKAITDTLKQQAGPQTYAMMATIIINAFVFQDTLAGASEVLIEVPTIAKMSATPMKPSKGEVIAAWEKILKINYWPIFGVAKELVEDMPATLWGGVSDACLRTADDLLSRNLGKNPDLVGTIFQRLISDRKFLATFYTAPASAALMARLLIGERSPNDADWSDVEKVAKIKIADFACGTGSLLCAVYADVRMRLDHAGVDSGEMHRSMIEHSLVGSDVLPSATYITASQLSSAHPTVQYGNTNIVTLSFGKAGANEYALGAIDLLETQRTMSTIATHGVSVGATALMQTETWAAGGTEVEDASFHIIAMNPPFTRLTGGGGKDDDNSRPFFAAFGIDEATQKRMAAKTASILSDTAYHGNAGFGSAFVEIGHRKLKAGGRSGFILPLGALSGSAWSKSRDRWRKFYKDVITISIAGDDKHSAFSADTKMAEAMVVATKVDTTKDKPDTRLTSISLHRRPESPLEGAEMAREIRQLIAAGNVRRIEDGPLGGTDILIGSEKVGEMVTAPSKPDPWPLSRIHDHSVAQAAHQLANTTIWLPGSLQASLSDVPLCALDQLGRPGPYHLDISSSSLSGGAPRGPFELKKSKKAAAASFPVLKEHDEKRERYIEIEPDAEAKPRKSSSQAEQAITDARAKAIWSTRTRLHFSTDLRFNANALVACLTTREALGARAWPSFCLHDRSFEKVVTLWFNSTLGILSFWWSANKTQSGRGSVTTSRLGEMTSIDPRRLDSETLAACDVFYDSFKTKPLMDVHEAQEDAHRAELDRFVAETLLKAGSQLKHIEDGIELLRSKLAMEPTIRGGKAG